MFRFELSNDLLDQIKKTINILKEIFKEQDAEINHLSYLSEQRLVLARQAEIFTLQINILEEILHLEVVDPVEVNENYKERYNLLKSEFIESHKSMLSNKDRPYLYEFGQTILITPELRQQKIEQFTNHQLPAEMINFENFIISPETDKQKLLLEIKNKLEYCIKLYSQIQELQIQESTKIQSKHRTSHNELNDSRNKIKNAIIKSFYNSCLFGSVENVRFHLKNTYFTKKLLNNSIDMLGNGPLHLLSQRDEAISENIRTILMNVDNLPLEMVINYDSNNAHQISTLLLESGASISMKNNFHYDALHTALQANKSVLFKQMLAKDATDKYRFKPNFTQTGEYGRTLLHTGSYLGHLDLIRLIPENIIYQIINNKTVGDNQESSALHFAAEQNHPSIVNWLLDFNPDTQLINKYDETALMSAIILNHTNIAKLFFDNGIWLTADQENHLISNEKYLKNRANIILLIKNIFQPKLSELIELSIFNNNEVIVNNNINQPQGNILR